MVRDHDSRRLLRELLFDVFGCQRLRDFGVHALR
jgi:hypothetical protein